MGEVFKVYHVFLPSGKALTFHEVEVKIDDVNLLIFDYVSKGTGVRMTAKFQQQNVVGTSHSND